ncbi:MAG: glycerophosphoryl diester phosphodiesterase membrane domain-containing protein [Erysipelotrichaceae bacterium]|nr:glycerophosphoryl diester phosphodiesterase membrane domain-containing protein [Erysipelotrichaceae bacterium]
MKYVHEKKLLRDIFKFEIFYKILVLFVFGPILRWILNMYLNNVSYGIVFNSETWRVFLSTGGIVVFLLMMISITLMIYYETYVFIQIIAIYQQKRDYSLREIMFKSLYELKHIHKPSFILTCAYYAGLIPLVHIGYLNSYIQKWTIPSFIFKELRSTISGQLLTILFYGAYYLLFIMMLFVPIYMILKRQNIMQATSSSKKLLKSFNFNSLMKILVMIIIWIMAEIGINQLLPYSTINNKDFNFYFLKYLIHSTSFRNAFIQYILMFIIYLLAKLGFTLPLVKIILNKEEDIYYIDEQDINIQWISQTAIKVRNDIEDNLWALSQLISRSKIYQNYKKIIYFILVCILILCLSLYLDGNMLIHTPQVMGHRGCDETVENTYGAVAKACAYGADYAEIDIQLTSDGVPVVFHDTSMSRLSNENVNVADITADEFESIELSQNGYSAYGLTLAHMIEEIQENELAISLLIELKPTDDNYKTMVDAVIEVVEEHYFASSCIYMSQNYTCVRYMNQQRPQYWVGYCIYSSVGEIGEEIFEMDIDFLAMEENLVSTTIIQEAVAQMLPVYVWTVDNEKSMKQYLNMGVTGIISDSPDVARSVVDSYLESDHHTYYYEEDEYRILGTLGGV